MPQTNPLSNRATHVSPFSGRFWSVGVPIRNISDYSPFGVQLDGRTVSLDNYRYGFNGMEGDPEFKGQGNSYTTEFRQYDARVGRWLSLDPLMAKFPWQSPYVAFDNVPTVLRDPRGLEGENPNEGKEVEGIEAKDNITWNTGKETPIIPDSYRDGPKISDYNWNKIYGNYDSNGEGILRREKALNDLAYKGTNTCAIKLSNTFNISGYPIPRREETPFDIRIRNGKNGDSGNFILDAASIANYMMDIEKPTETYTIRTEAGIYKMIDDIQSKYHKMKGIMVYVVDYPSRYGHATGHADLISENCFWSLTFYSGKYVGMYLKDNVLPQTSFTFYLWVLEHE